MALDPTARTIGLDGGERLTFDRRRPGHGRRSAPPRRPGRRPRRCPLPPHDATTRVRLSDAIRAASRVAVVGAGWIGSEVAASARQMGADVVLVDPAPVPLHRVLGDEIGAVFAAPARRPRRRRCASAPASPSSAARSPVEAVVLDDGRVEPADVVVVGVGVAPRTELADAAGLRVDNGVVVDEHLATGVPGHLRRR